MSEIFTLREKPKLEITLGDKKIQIIDNNNLNNNGIYFYHELKMVELNEERTNWYLSVGSHILGFILGSAINGDHIKNKATLNFTIQNQTIRLALIDADVEKVKIFKRKIDKRYNPSIQF